WCRPPAPPARRPPTSRPIRSRQTRLARRRRTSESRSPCRRRVSHPPARKTDVAEWLVFQEVPLPGRLSRVVGAPLGDWSLRARRDRTPIPAIQRRLRRARRVTGKSRRLRGSSRAQLRYRSIDPYLLLDPTGVVAIGWPRRIGDDGEARAAASRRAKLDVMPEKIGRPLDDEEAESKPAGAGCRAALKRQENALLLDFRYAGASIVHFDVN